MCNCGGTTAVARKKILSEQRTTAKKTLAKRTAIKRTAVRKTAVSPTISASAKKARDARRALRR